MREKLKELGIDEIAIKSALAWNRRIVKLNKAIETRDIVTLRRYLGLPSLGTGVEIV
jgi:hypothetical protein